MQDLLSKGGYFLRAFQSYHSPLTEIEFQRHDARELIGILA